MFKVAVFTDGISQDFHRALDVAANEFKLKYVELRTIWGKNIIDLEKKEIDKVKEEIDKRNLSVCCIASPFLKCKLTEQGEVDETDIFFAEGESYEKHLDIFERSIQLAKIFNVNLVRCFGFWREKLTPDLWQEMLNRVRKAVKIAEKNNLVLVMENCAGLNISTAKEASRLFEEIDSPYLRLLWDPDNSFHCREIPYPDGYSLIKQHIAHVHVRDSIWDRDGNKAKYVAVGDGEIDWKGQLKALLDDNYEGTISLENNYSVEGNQEAGTKRSFWQLKEILASIDVDI